MESKLLPVLIFIVTTVTVTAVSNTSVGEFVEINNCTCPGDILVYNCIVNGKGFTIWKGSAFQCPNVGSMISLQHSTFGGRGTKKSCNAGAIIGSSVGVSMDNSTYTSQLMINLTASSSAVGGTVECVYRNISGSETTIGSAFIQITDPPLPPNYISLLRVTPTELTFNWTSVQSNCSSFQYQILSDCGSCTDGLTTENVKTCSISQSTTTVSMCSFAVRSVICRNISGISSMPVNVSLKVPESPVILSVIPHYDMADKLTMFDIKFMVVDSFLISKGVDGTPVDYTVSYIDSRTNALCDSLTIPVINHCAQNVCSVPNIQPLPCSETTINGTISIAISAINKLGKGPANTFSIESVNTDIRVMFGPRNRMIICIFSHQQINQSKMSLTCNISYGPCQAEPSMYEKVQGNANSSNTVIIDLPPSFQSSMNCYIINASNSTFTVIVHGTASESYSEPNVAAIVIGVVLAVVLATCTVPAIIIVLVVKKVRKTTVETQDIPLTRQESDPHQTVSAHIIFDLKDKPKELMAALSALKKVNIQTVKIGPQVATETGKEETRKIYIQCQEDLNDDIKNGIEKSLSNIGMDLAVHQTPQATEYRNVEAEGVKIEITEFIEHLPGALYNLLEFVYSVETWKQINITDIKISNSQNGHHDDQKCVVIKFHSAVTIQWKEQYDKKKKKESQETSL